MLCSFKGFLFAAALGVASNLTLASNTPAASTSAYALKKGYDSDLRGGSHLTLLEVIGLMKYSAPLPSDDPGFQTCRTQGNKKLKLGIKSVD